MDQRSIAIPDAEADRIAKACHDAYHTLGVHIKPTWVDTVEYRHPWYAAALAAVQAYDRYLQGVADDQAAQLAGVPTFQAQLQAAIDAEDTRVQAGPSGQPGDPHARQDPIGDQGDDYDGPPVRSGIYS
jgi:hypothetical protein